MCLTLDRKQKDIKPDYIWTQHTRASRQTNISLTKELIVIALLMVSWEYLAVIIHFEVITIQVKPTFLYRLVIWI